VLEAAVPVLRHLAAVALQHADDLVDRLLGDDRTKACPIRAVRRDHDRHVLVRDLNRQVFALVTEFLLDDRPRPVMRVDDLVPDFVHVDR
jgi:hypothetical protein